MVAMLWTVWLARNENFFRGIKQSKIVLLHLIKHRALIWSIAGNLIPPDILNLWAVDPQAAYSRRIKWELKNLLTNWFQCATLVGFIDASWKTNKNNIKKAGIGGFLMNSTGRVVFMFSGPSKKNTSYESECEALEFMLGSILFKNLASTQIVIFLDAIQVVKEAMKGNPNQVLNM